MHQENIWISYWICTNFHKTNYINEVEHINIRFVENWYANMSGIWDKSYSLLKNIHMVYVNVITTLKTKSFFPQIHICKYVPTTELFETKKFNFLLFLVFAWTRYLHICIYIIIYICYWYPWILCTRLVFTLSSPFIFSDNLDSFYVRVEWTLNERYKRFWLWLIKMKITTKTTTTTKQSENGVMNDEEWLRVM